MSRHLLRAGHSVCVYDRDPLCVEAVESAGGKACASSKDVASKSDVVFIMVPDTPDVEAVIFGKNGVAEGIRAGAIVVDMSSISPIATRDFARRLAAIGVKMLDAPVSGGTVGAEQATLSIMVGGDRAVFEQVKPCFEILGKNIVHIGGNGDGQTCKVANQIAVALTIEAVSEALLFASRAGADPAKVREALLGGFASSRILDLHGKRMIEHNFKPGFRVRHQQKDLNLALQGARALGLSLPCAAVVQELYNSLCAQGGTDLDHSALVTVLERLSGHTVGKQQPLQRSLD
jgi:2-hydroxy-3-oxopropionate reductase